MVDPSKVLSDVSSQHLAFWFNNGPVAKNLYEFASAVEACDAKTFKHHVNSERNDFVNWIFGVIGDEDLAGAVKQEKTKRGFVSKLKKRIKELEKLRKTSKKA